MYLGPQELEPEDARDVSASQPEQGAEEIDLEALIAQAVIMSRDGQNDESVLAAARGYVRGNSGRFNSPGRPQREAPVRRFGTPGLRVATPPRDPKDNKCANCNITGLTKENGPKPQISIEDKVPNMQQTGSYCEIVPRQRQSRTSICQAGTHGIAGSKHGHISVPEPHFAWGQ